MTLLATVLAVGAVPMALGLLLDPRVVTNLPVWAKPLKFSLSVAIYCFTFVWLLSHLRRFPRTGAVLGHVTAAMFAFEMFAVIFQAARGTTSHFNDDSPFDALLFAFMGIAIIVVTLTAALLLLLFLFQRGLDPAFALGLRAGLLVSLVGSAVGGFMVGASAHTVGAPDGGSGLPILGWSTTDGDLRPAHFLGLHALQMLPIMGAFIARRSTAAARARAGLVAVTAAAYVGLIVVLTIQAFRQEPLFSPDPLTLGLLAALVAVIVVALVIASRLASREVRLAKSESGSSLLAPQAPLGTARRR